MERKKHEKVIRESADERAERIRRKAKASAANDSSVAAELKNRQHTGKATH